MTFVHRFFNLREIFFSFQNNLSNNNGRLNYNGALKKASKFRFSKPLSQGIEFLARGAEFLGFKREEIKNCTLSTCSHLLVNEKRRATDQAYLKIFVVLSEHSLPPDFA